MRKYKRFKWTLSYLPKHHTFEIWVEVRIEGENYFYAADIPWDKITIVAIKDVLRTGIKRLEHKEIEIEKERL